MNIYAIAIGTVVIIIFSWFLSIKHKRYHGIARFFSFESIFILLAMNKEVWFDDPFSVRQMLSWILFILSIYLAIAGFILLKKVGKPSGGNFENTSALVRTGLYKYIRHPLYMSLLLLGTGEMLKDPGSVQITIGLINLVAVYITARIEEREMIARFGEEYRTYMKETKMFLPFVF
jgi:protein-S-isoprenylcysteine O-methyltransferase Ste14